MTAPRAFDPDALAASLPRPRGRLTPMRPLADLSWLRVGGPAELFFQPADAEDLRAVLAAAPEGLPVTPLGVCSNLIIRDGGLPGLSVRLGRAFAQVRVEGERVIAGAAALDSHVARAAAAAGVSGLEFLRTIPGAVGGAVRMNAGCYGAYMADVVEEIAAIDRAGRLVRLSAAEIGFAYRSSDLPPDLIVIEATLRGAPGDRARIEALMQEYVARREASQPVRARSCGSTFRNPAGYSSTGRADDVHDMKAWRLIDEAGCRGLRRGGAMISDKHANFLLNVGGATAADLEGLGEEVRKRVFENSGVRLEWEIARIGVPAPPGAAGEGIAGEGAAGQGAPGAPAARVNGS